VARPPAVHLRRRALPARRPRRRCSPTPARRSPTTTPGGRVAARVDGSGPTAGSSSDGTLVRVTMVEKLLVPALAKLSSYVAGGGIWMNTQRPEWNDANNALAGYGLSMVTLYHLERYLGFLEELLVAGGRRRSAVSVRWRLARGRRGALAPTTPEARSTTRRASRSSTRSGRRPRPTASAVAGGFDPPTVEVDARPSRSCWPRRGRTCGRRSGPADVTTGSTTPTTSSPSRRRHRRGRAPPPMLEGQVAVLGTTELDAAQAGLVEALFGSELYRTRPATPSCSTRSVATAELPRPQPRPRRGPARSTRSCSTSSATDPPGSSSATATAGSTSAPTSATPRR
jgi:hypothetical protein